MHCTCIRTCNLRKHLVVQHLHPVEVVDGSTGREAVREHSSLLGVDQDSCMGDDLHELTKVNHCKNCAPISLH